VKDTILLVEDQENDAFFLKRAFGVAGIQNPIQVVQDGKEAMNYLSGIGVYADRARFPMPCLILLDLKLPRVMGLEVLRWLRAQSELKTLIVLILTSSRAATDIEMAYQLGVNGYLVKPSGSEELQEIARGIKAFWLEANIGPLMQRGSAKPSRPDAKGEIGTYDQRF
jgi:CheY-like chemotaxis protein